MAVEDRVYHADQQTLASFESGAADWDAYTRTPHGAMRQALVLEHLHSHLPEGQLEVLDVGAGTGGYALELAKAGHHVTLIDYSPAMLELARGRFGDAGADVLSRAVFVVAPVSSLEEQLAGKRYDIVLVHTLLEYLPEAHQSLRDIIKLVSPGGMLSLLLVNTCGDIVRQAMVKHDPAGALAALGGKPAPPALFGEGRRLLPLSEVRETLGHAGVEIVSHRGIRIFADAYSADALARDATYASLIALERATGTRDPYRQIGRYHHLLGVRQATTGPR